MNWNMEGHEWAVEMLQQHVAGGNLRHAYLFTGPAGVGRRTLALRLTQAINCPQPTAPGRPCRTCRTCKQIDRAQHPDLLVAQAEQEGGILKVETIRNLQHNLILSPYAARYRVGLLLRFEEANLNAANALLKTLEEAPPKAVLLLTADTPESLLPTVVSRCEVLRLRPLPLEKEELYLRDIQGLPVEQARLLAHLSGGRLGYALRLAADPASLEQRSAWLDELHTLLQASRKNRFDFAEKIAKDKENLRRLLLIWLSYWRDVMLCTARSDAPLVNLDRTQQIEALAGGMDLTAARLRVEALENALDYLSRNVNPRLLTEVLLLDWPYLSQ